MSRKKKILRLDKNKQTEIIEEEAQIKRQEEEKSLPGMSLVSQLGFSISLPIAGGAFLGQFLDNKFNSSPKMTLSLVFLGVCLSLVNIYLIIKENSK